MGFEPSPKAKPLCQRWPALCVLSWLAVACGGRTSQHLAVQDRADAAPPTAVSPEAGLPEPAAGGSTAVEDAENAGTSGSLDATPQGHIARFRQAAYERGLEICKCNLPAQAPADRELCAQEESTHKELFQPSGQRCALELIHSDPLFQDYLDCQAQWFRNLSACENRTCPAATCQMGPFCPMTPQLRTSWESCRSAFFCGDVRADLMRCNDVVECPDGSDELGCGPGRVICDDPTRITTYSEICDARVQCLSVNSCVMDADAQRWAFACGDGKAISFYQVCDGTKDCTDGSDEQRCAP